MTADAFCMAAACCADVEDEGLRPCSGGSPFCEQDTGDQDSNGDDIIEGNVDSVFMVPVCSCCCNNLQQNTGITSRMMTSHLYTTAIVHP